jgi:rhodanese-related sulfurtransferase
MVVIILLSLTLVIGCVENNKDDETDNVPDNNEQIIEDISNEASYQMILENKNNSNFIILDIRTTEEFADGHIEDAVNIDFYSSTFNDELDKLDKTKTYLVYCRTANRSGQAMPMMKELGFEEVYNMLGGIVEWENNNYPIVYD